MPKQLRHYIKHFKYQLIRMHLKLETFLAAEQENWLAWLVIAFGSGIYYGLSIPPEPLSAPIYIGIIAGSILIYWIYSKQLNCPLSIILSLAIVVSLCLGLWRSKHFVSTLNSPQLQYSIASADISGVVEEILFNNAQSKHLIIKPNHIKILKCSSYRSAQGCQVNKLLAAEQRPIRIRLAIQTTLPPELRSGSLVRLHASLNPNPPQLLPRAYNFAEIAFFQQIGAVGKLQGKLTVEQTSSSSNTKLIYALENLRLKIKQRLEKNMQQPAAGVAVALLVGYPGAILQKPAEDMRTTGLAHLIAISGLHMATVVGLIFLICRYLCSLNINFSSAHDSKKLSAVIAMLVGFCYLALSGFAISAQRAYLMTVLMLAAIIFERRIFSLRSVAITVVILLIYNPYLIKSPSFQMSFAAVISLITAFNISMQYLRHPSGTTIRSIMDYLMGILIGSLATEIIINPIAIYHFFLYSPYGDIVNFIAMPLTTFIIIPCGFIGLFLMPLGLEFPALKIMEYGINIILYSAAFTLEAGKAIFIIAKLPAFWMRTMVFSALWLAVIKHRIRFLGIISLGIAFIAALLAPKPNLVVLPKQYYFLAKLRNGYCSSKVIRSDYQYQMITKYLGVKQLASCPQQLEIYSVDRQLYRIVNLSRPAELRQFCQQQLDAQPTVVINFTDLNVCLKTLPEHYLVINARQLTDAQIILIKRNQLLIRQ